MDNRVRACQQRIGPVVETAHRVEVRGQFHIFAGAVQTKWLCHDLDRFGQRVALRCSLSLGCILIFCTIEGAERLPFPTLPLPHTAAVVIAWACHEI
jgi:hypothetical protein